jgi:hypothetical protein
MSSVYKLWTGENFDPASKSNTGHTHALSDIYNWGNYSAPTYEGIWPSGVTKGNGNFAVLWQKNNYDLYLNASNSINFQTTDGTTRTNKFIITPTFAEFFVSAKVNGDFTTTGAISANDVNAKVLRANMPVTGDGPGQGAHIALYDNAGGKGWLFQHGSTNDRLSFMHLDGGAAWNSKVYFTQNGDIAAQGAMIAGIWAAGTHVVGGGWSWSGHQTLNSVNWSGFMHNANGETLIGSTNNMSLRLAVNQADIATVTSTGMSVYNKVTAGNAGVGNWVYNTDGAFFGLASENKESWSGMLMVYGNQYLTSPNDIQLASKSTGGKARFLLETTSTAGINSSAAAFTGESSTMPTNAYNWGFCLRNDRQTVGLSIFMNGSTRSLDGGPDAVTIRNEEGKLILGHTLKPTEIFGSSFTYNGTTVSLNGHTHSYQPIGDYSLTGHTHNFLNNLGGANDTRNIDNAYTDGTSQFASYIISNATGTNPFNTQPGNNHCKVLEMSYTDAGNWHHQISLDFFTDSMAFRRRDTSVWQPWRTLWHSGNLTPVSLAANNTWTGINTYTNTIYYDGSMIRRFNGSNYGLGISESITFSYKYTINDSWETFMGYDISEFYLRSNNNPLNIVGAAVSIRNSDTNPTTLIEAKNDLSGPYINMSSPRISMTGQIQNLEIKNSQYSIITLTSPTTATTSYYNYNYVNISDNAGTLRLPSAPLNPGKWFAVFCRTDGAGVTFTSTSGGMVTNWDGSWKGSSYTPQNTSFRCFIFRSNGEDWFISM